MMNSLPQWQITWELPEFNMTIRSYIIVRKDLTPSQQAVQAAHAAQEVGFRSDLPESPVHLVLLGVKDAQEFS